jgi:hypothetical protein
MNASSGSKLMSWICSEVLKEDFGRVGKSNPEKVVVSIPLLLPLPDLVAVMRCKKGCGA